MMSKSIPITTKLFAKSYNSFRRYSLEFYISNVYQLPICPIGINLELLIKPESGNFNMGSNITIEKLSSNIMFSKEGEDYNPSLLKYKVEQTILEMLSECERKYLLKIIESGKDGLRDEILSVTPQLIGVSQTIKELENLIEYI